MLVSSAELQQLSTRIKTSLRTGKNKSSNLNNFRHLVLDLNGLLRICSYLQNLKKKMPKKIEESRKGGFVLCLCEAG